jgi:hypothetical protein
VRARTTAHIDLVIMVMSRQPTPVDRSHKELSDVYGSHKFAHPPIV